MWSRFDLSATLTRPFAHRAPRDHDSTASAALDLTFEELVAMRDRRARFGRNRAVDGFRFGNLTSRRRGSGLELDSIGPYQRGDDIRHMDWFATARIGRPQIKQFRHDVQQTIILVIDLRPSMMFGSSIQLMAKTACLAAANIAWSTSRDHQPLGLLLVGKSAKYIPARRGRRARFQHLRRIAEAYREARHYADEPPSSLDIQLRDLPMHMAGDVEAVIISDFSGLGDDFDRRLREIGARGGESAVVIEDPLLRAPPPAGIYPMRNQRDHQLAAVAIRKHDENVYRMEAEQQRRSLKARLLSLGMRQVLTADAQAIHEGFFR